jgi:hypothetical protein
MTHFGPPPPPPLPESAVPPKSYPPQSPWPADQPARRTGSGARDESVNSNYALAFVALPKR